MRSKRGIRWSAEEDSHSGMVNLTPLIDVVFVVLIMFILVAPMLELEKIHLARAAPHLSKEPIAVKENRTWAIYVRADNSIYVNKTLVDLPKLLQFLLKIKEVDPHYIPQLFHDKKAYFETYQSIKNVVETAGFEEMDLILQPG